MSINIVGTMMAASNIPSAKGHNAPRPGRKTSRTMPARECPISDPIEVARFWKSARDRQNSVVVAIKQYEGHVFLDCRVFGTNADGQAVPTAKGVTVGVALLPVFLGAVRKAYEKAVELGLVNGEDER